MLVNRIVIAALLACMLTIGIANPAPQFLPGQTPGRRNSRPVGGDLGRANVVPGEGLHWTPSKQSAAELAAKTDQAMGWLKGWGLFDTFSFKDQYIVGKSSCRTEIVSPTRFHIEYATAGVQPANSGHVGTVLAKVIVFADGKQMAFQSSLFGLRDRQPVATAKLPDSCDLSIWPKEFPKLLKSAFKGGKPFSRLVAAAQASGNLRIKVDERQFDFKGQILHQRRLTILKKTKSATPLGIEVVIDASQYLPVTIGAQSGSSKADRIESTWTGTWGQPKGGRFDPRDFEVPKILKTVSKG